MDEESLIDVLRADPAIRRVIGQFKNSLGRELTIAGFEEVYDELRDYSQITIPKVEPHTLDKVNECLRIWARRAARIGEIYTCYAPASAQVRILRNRALGHLYQHPKIAGIKSYDERKKVAAAILEEIDAAHERLKGMYLTMDRISTDLRTARQAVEAQQENLKMSGAMGLHRG